MAERLTFRDNSIPHGSLLVSKHLSRYLLVREQCRGLRVLDIACGDGHGSALLRSWGASEVVGVDISPEAVRNARTLFGQTAGLTFVESDATRGGELGSLGQFDLIVCFETIEHVVDVEGLLTGLSQLKKPQGAIVISGSNDAAVIPGAADEHHPKTCSFEAFQNTVTTVLGPADTWLLGTSVIGFGAVPLHSPLLTAPPKGPIGLLDMAEARGAQFMASQAGHEVTVENAAYYIAAWGCTLTASSVFAPISFAADESPGNNRAASQKEKEATVRASAVLKIQLAQAEQAAANIRKDFEMALTQRDLAIANLRKLNDEASDQLRRVHEELRFARKGALSAFARKVRAKVKAPR